MAVFKRIGVKWGPEKMSRNPNTPRPRTLGHRTTMVVTLRNHSGIKLSALSRIRRQRRRHTSSRFVGQYGRRRRHRYFNVLSPPMVCPDIRASGTCPGGITHISRRDSLVSELSVERNISLSEAGDAAPPPTLGEGRLRGGGGGTIQPESRMAPRHYDILEILLLPVTPLGSSRKKKKSHSCDATGLLFFSFLVYRTCRLQK